MTRIDNQFITTMIQLSQGRVLHALLQLEARLQAGERDVFGAHLDRAAEAAREAIAVAAVRREATRSLYQEAARDRDVELDAALAAVASLLAAFGDKASLASSATSVRERAEAAAAIGRLLFPRGLGGLTRSAFADEVGHLEYVQQAFAEPEWVARIGTVPGASELLDRVYDAAAALRATLAKAPSDEVTYRDEQAAKVVANERLAELVMLVLAHHWGDDEVAVQRRSVLLEPIADQLEAVRALYRRSLPVTDVEPETGAPLPVETVETMDGSEPEIAAQ